MLSVKLHRHTGRSREGAWIEISVYVITFLYPIGRSREGAWIEISVYVITFLYPIGRSREGAWIEMFRKADH